ncbi:hypothetical protein AB0873_07235 [Micromonospora sp. NPDC047707]|uniref:hypothetical protein n=1 Tax=Micromonospora sp. NPDC047707 TaxID=3154498 RepID=UPI0034522118
MKRSYLDTSTNPYSVDARTKMMGSLAGGTGGSRVARAVMRAVAGIALVGIGVSIVLAVLDLVV